MELSQANLDSTVGRLVVEKGLAAKQDVERLMESLKQGSSMSGVSGGGDEKQKSLAHLLVAEGLVTQKQIERLKPELEERKAGAQIPGYQIIKQLGAGAMARVYLAKQISLDRMVAIKVLPQKFTNNADFVARFYAEGKAAAKLNHPNIVQAIDVGHSGEFHYFVMEFVEGADLSKVIKTGDLSTQQTGEIIAQVCDALGYAHDKGYVH
ncbi:MAG: serine/threonine-protein kinase, partial [Planctomycetota bacterium]